LEEKIGGALRSLGLKLAVVESCTGGLVGHRITNIPGSSDYYVGSITAYANEVKERLVGVRHDTLLEKGAVSRETVLEMAAGIRRALAAEFTEEKIIGLSTSGIAGPGGGTPTKPVGLVWIGLSTAQGEWAWQIQGHGNRVENKNYAADCALNYLWEYLRNMIYEPVNVIARPLAAGQFEPLQFVYRGQVIQIADVGRQWTEAGEEHILVMNERQQVFELVLASDRISWFVKPEGGAIFSI
jgi:PncC family amidohydrolase